MNYIYFKAKEWRFNQGCKSNVGECFFMQDCHNELQEVFQLGNWQDRWSEIESPDWAFEPETPYTFVFWLNGGENEGGDEVCKVEVIFDGDLKNRSAYKLNRNYIKPVLKYCGWELYAVSFVTPAKEEEVITTLRFVANKAPMTVMPAKDLEYYLEWKEEKDPYESYRPQRHNIVFEDGWPSIKMYGGEDYSTEALRKLHPEIEAQKGKSATKANKADPGSEGSSGRLDWNDNLNHVIKGVTKNAQKIAINLRTTAENFKHSPYQEKLSEKTKDAVNKVKSYGSAVGEQAGELIAEMMSAENQEKMQEVVARVEDAIADAVAKGDRVRVQVLEHAKETLQNYRDAKKQEEEDKAEALEEAIAEETERLEGELDELENQICDVEDAISETEDALEEIEDIIEERNESLADATDEEKLAILTEVKEHLFEKAKLLTALQEQRAKLEEIEKERDSLEKQLNELEN